MPTVSRTRLRQSVGLLKLRDTYVGTTTHSFGAGGSVTIIDATVANLAFSGESLFARTWLKVNGMELRVASFNTGSGAYVTLQTAGTMVPSGGQYEHHRKVSPTEKDRAIDGIIGRLWTRQEIPLAATNLGVYSLGEGKVFDAYYFATPTASGNRGQTTLPLGWTIAMTATGRELRLPLGFALGSGAQLIIDGQVRATLGAADSATVDIPDEDWVLNGVAARCYQALIADAPGQEAGRYATLAQAYANEFVKGIGRFRSEVSYGWRGSFDEVVT